MSLSLALGSSARAGAGISISGPPSLRPRPPLQHGLRRLRRDAAGCRLSNRGSVCKAEGTGDETKVSVRVAAAGAATAAAGMMTTTSSARVPLGQSKRWHLYSPGINTGGKQRGDRVVCSASALDFETLQWISSISCLVLMLAKGTAVQKSFLAPLFALQAPSSVISWIKGEYGIWTAFLALLVRLFYFIPGELDLPFLTMLLVIVTPHQTARLRETKIGVIISLVIAGYLLFQHFSRAGSLQKAFDQGSVVATLAVICLIIVPCLLLF